MEIPRSVILDLLPLYMADEVRAETRALIEKFLETDPELAEIARQSEAVELPGDIPIPLNKEHEMQAYKKSRWLMILTVVILAVLITAILGIMLFAFLVSA